MCLFFCAPAWQFVVCVCACAPFAELFFFLADFTHDGAATSHTAENWLIFIATAIWLSGGAVGCTLNLHPALSWQMLLLLCGVADVSQSAGSSQLFKETKVPFSCWVYLNLHCEYSKKNTTSAYREQECVILYENMITTNKVSLLNSPNEKQVQLRPSKSEFSSFHPHLTDVHHGRKESEV